MPQPFVLLNIRKTGTQYISTFVRNADLLSNTRKLRINGLFLRHPRLFRITMRGWHKLRRLGVIPGLRLHELPGKHHILHCQLPAALRTLPAVSALREPLDWYVSRYAYVKEIYASILVNILQNTAQPISDLLPPALKHTPNSFVQKYLGGENSIPAWGKISLEGFWHFENNFRKYWQARRNINITAAGDWPTGMLSCITLMHLHRDPQRLFSMPVQEMQEYLDDGRWRKDLCQVWFLRQEHLQEDLRCVMLERLGYEREVLDAAEQLTPARVNPSNPDIKERALRELEQKPQLREDILRSERFYSEQLLPLAGNFRDA